MLKKGVLKGFLTLTLAVALVLSLVVTSLPAIAVAPPATESSNSSCCETGDGSCFAIAVGRNASADGSTFFSHNEDCGGVLVNRQYVIPRKQYQPGDVIVMEDTGNVIPQVPETWATLRSEGSQAPPYQNCDHYLNEWGVGIGSNAQTSNEILPYDLTNGGIRYWTRRLVAERAKTAREGVQIIGQMVETYGYNGSGRVYTVIDPKEVWLCAVVAGRHWVAERVPDGEVVVYSNRYPLRQINLKDKEHFMGSKDLISYAIEKGWYDPASGPFDFGKAYGKASAQDSLSNTLRQQEGLRLITGITYPLNDMPFSVKPNKKLTIEDIRKVMSNHYEGTPNDQTVNGDPHRTSTRTICTASTQNLIVIQGRQFMPTFVGSIYWRAQGRGCEGVLVPWYSGALEIPKPYTVGEASNYNKLPLAERYYDPNSAYWVFNKMNELVTMDYKNREPLVRAVWDKMESTEFAMQDEIEKAAIKIYQGNNFNKSGGNEYLAKWFLTRYTSSLALDAYYKSLDFINQFSN